MGEGEGGEGGESGEIMGEGGDFGMGEGLDVRVFEEV